FNLLPPDFHAVDHPRRFGDRVADAHLRRGGKRQVFYRRADRRILENLERLWVSGAVHGALDLVLAGGGHGNAGLRRNAPMSDGAGVGALEPGLLPDVRILRRRGLQRDERWRIVAKIPVEAVPAL